MQSAKNSAKHIHRKAFFIPTRHLPDCFVYTIVLENPQFYKEYFARRAVYSVNDRNTA